MLDDIEHCDHVETSGTCVSRVVQVSRLGDEQTRICHNIQ